MRRLFFQGAILGASLLAFVVAILSFAHSYAPALGARCAESLVASKWPMWVGCTMAAHENLAGGLIGASGALFAAWIAWVAIDRQIRETRHITLLTTEETLAVARIEMRNILELLNEIWRTVDWILMPGDEQQFQARFSVVTVTASTWPTNFSVKNLEEIAAGLTPARRRSFAAVILHLAFLHERLVEMAKLRIDDELAKHRITIFRIFLSHLHRYLLEFDQSLADVFQDRHIVDVNHQNMAAHIRGFVNEHVGQGGNP